MESGSGTVGTLNRVDPAFEAALTENHGDFLRFLRRRLGSMDDAEDVLQQFYMRAIRNASKVRKKKSIVAWLYRVLRSTLIDHYRREAVRRSNVSAFAQFQSLHENEYGSDNAGEICPCLYKVLPTLKPEYYDVLWRVDLAGEGRSSVAELRGLTLNNLTVRLHRARRALKKALLIRCEWCTDIGFLDCACDLPRPAAKARFHPTLEPPSAQVS